MSRAELQRLLERAGSRLSHAQQQLEKLLGGICVAGWVASNPSGPLEAARSFIRARLKYGFHQALS